MLYRDDEGLKLSNKKVVYLQNGAQEESLITTDGVEWWVEFANKWSNTEIVEFVDISYTEEQLTRFENIKNMDINIDALNLYVLEGLFPEGIDDPLRNLQLESENVELKSLLADLTGIVLLGGM